MTNNINFPHCLSVCCDDDNNDDDDDDDYGGGDDDDDGIHPKYLRRIYLQVYPPDFCHHHHYVVDDNFAVCEFHCDGNVDADDDLNEYDPGI